MNLPDCLFRLQGQDGHWFPLPRGLYVAVLRFQLSLRGQRGKQAYRKLWKNFSYERKKEKAIAKGTI